MCTQSRLRVSLVLVALGVCGLVGPRAEANEPLFTFGGFGAGPGLFLEPVNLACNQVGDIAVVDLMAANIQVFDALGTHLFTFGSFGTGPGQFMEPYGVAFTPEGNIAVLSRRPNRLQLFDANGVYLKTLLSEETPRPGNLGNLLRKDLAIRQDGMIAIVMGADTVKLYDKNGKFVRRFGTLGKGPGQFDRPSDVEFTSDGHLVIADRFNIRVQVLDERGRFIRQVGKDYYPALLNWQAPDDDLDYVYSAAVNADDDVAVTSEYYHPVKMFSIDGTFFSRVFPPGTIRGPRGVRQYQRVSFNPATGALIMLDLDAKIVKVYQPAN